MSDESSEPRQPEPRGDRLQTYSARAGVAWDLAKKYTLVFGVLFVIGLAVHDVVRECLDDRITLDPVVVKVPASDGAPTPEMVAQQTVNYMNFMRGTGASEWRESHLRVDQYSTPAVINVQIPGSSLNLETVVREIASLFPTRRRTLRISLTPKENAAGYAAALTVVGGYPREATCESDGKPGSLGVLFECLAIEATKSIDPLFVASYHLSVESAKCASFDVPKDKTLSAVETEALKMRLQRDHCNFGRTRGLVARLVERGRVEDQPWIPYLYGQVHLARAAALGKIDKQAEWYELDRAINRFREFKDQNVVAASALATEMDAYIKKGISIHESIGSLPWSDQKDSAIQLRLSAAWDILNDADLQLQRVANRKRHEDSIWGTRGNVADDSKLDALVMYLQGLIRYRKWMILTQQRGQSKDVNFVSRDPEEMSLLSDAVKKFEASYRQGRRLETLFMDWGNTLRAERDFDGAVLQYRRAGDIAPNGYAAPLNIAIALLEKIIDRPDGATPTDQFDALGHVSEYLSWSSGGGPFPNVIDKTVKALANTGNPADASLFAECRKSHADEEAPQTQPDLSHAAALKICVDEARNRIAGRLTAADGHASH